MNYNPEQEISTKISTPTPRMNTESTSSSDFLNTNSNTSSSNTQNIFQVMQEKQKNNQNDKANNNTLVDEDNTNIINVKNDIVDDDVDFMEDIDQDIDFQNDDDDYKYEETKENETLSDMDDISDVDDSDDDTYDTRNLNIVFDYKRKEALEMYHPECRDINYEEMISLSNVIRDNKGHIVDPLHKTIPILTKFEETKVLGIRISQLENGSDPLIHVDDNVEPNYIAEKELQEGVLPFIICRPLPGGKKEFWKLRDLEMFRAF